MIHGIRSGMNLQYLCLQSSFDVILKVSRCLRRYKNRKAEQNVDYMQFFNATSTAYGRDCSQLVYCEKQMRQHLVNCFSQKDLKPFPLINKESE